MNQYTELDYLKTIHKFLRDADKDFMILDACVSENKLMTEAIQWGLNEGMIVEDCQMSTSNSNGLYRVRVFRLNQGEL